MLTLTIALAVAAISLTTYILVRLARGSRQIVRTMEQGFEKCIKAFEEGQS